MSLLAETARRQDRLGTRKARDQQIQNQDRLVEAEAQALARILQRMFRLMAEEAADERLDFIKVRKARPGSRLLDQTNRIISAQAIEMFGRAARRSTESNGLQPRIDLSRTAGARDLLRRIEMLQERLGRSVNQNADRVLATILENRGNKPRRELAREYADQLAGSMTFDRAITWARTEAAVATNTGAAAAYEAAGVEEIEWMAFQFPIWPRRHDKMDGVRVPVGESFTLPSGARLRWPHDPLGPVGESVNCRCSHKPVRRRRGGRTAPQTPQGPTPAPPPPTQPATMVPPRPLPGRPQMTADEAGFDRDLMLRELRALSDVQGDAGETGRRVREQMRSLMAQRGFAATRGNRGIVVDQTAMPPHTAALMYGNGRMVMSEQTRDALGRVAQGQASETDQLYMSVLLHEEVHAHGPDWQRYGYTGGQRNRAIILEEMTTEVSARVIASEQFGSDPERGSYQGYIQQTRRVIRGRLPSSTSAAEIDAVIMGASQRFKARTGSAAPTTEAEAWQAFSEDVADEAEALGIEMPERADLIAQMRSELEKLDPDDI